VRPSNLVIAGFSISFDCDNDIVAGYLDRELLPFNGGDGSDLRLKLTVEMNDGSVDTGNSGGHIEVSLPTGMDIILRQDGLDDRIHLDATVVSPGDAGAIDHDYLSAFLLNYVMSLVMQQLQAGGMAHLFLVHSCGVMHDGRAMLFAGASGSGKSTVGRLLHDSGEKLLGDDMVLVSRDSDGWMAHGSPMGGDFPRTSLVNDTVPLEAIFMLRQGRETAVEQVSVAEATAELIGLLVPSYPLTRTAPKKISDYDRETLEILVDDAFLLAMDVPCYKLDLSLADQRWEEIFGMATKGRRS
jgi:hypothetical protein